MKTKNLLLNLGCFFALIIIFNSCKNTAQTEKNTTWYFSPIPSIGVGPNGLPTKKINVLPYCCPTDAIEITGTGIVSDNDFQWVNIPLHLPADTIKSVSVCYSTLNNAYISQTRLAVMTTPDQSLVKLDDATDQTSSSPTCYTVAANTKVDGTVTLSLRVVIPQNGTIRIGSISIVLK
jgi:hypothetical protein